MPARSNSDRQNKHLETPGTGGRRLLAHVCKSYLFASILERFVALYASVNSFTKLVYRTKQLGADVKRWPPRAGEQAVV